MRGMTYHWRKALILCMSALVIPGCATPSTPRSGIPSSKILGGESSFESEIKRIQGMYSRGEYPRAIESLSRIHEPELRNSEKTEYWNLKGLIRLAEKNPQAAIINFKRALQYNPLPSHEPYYQFNLATAYLDGSKPTESKKVADAIKTEEMTAPDRKKVLALRERVNKIVSGQTDPKTQPESANVSATPVAQVTPSASPPRELYAGPVNRKRIGVLLPLSGKYENFGKRVQRSVELAFQSSTDEQSKSFELIPVDSGDSAESHEIALKKLVEEQEVIAVIGPLLGKHLDSLRSKAAFYQIPLISVAQVQGEADPQIFSCSISTQDQAARIARYAVQTLGLTRFAILGPDNKAGEEMAHAFWSELERLNAEVRAFELYDPDLTDFREPVDKTLGLFYTETRAKELEELAEKRKELNITRKTMKTLQYFNLPPLVDFEAVFIADEARTAGQVIPTFAYRDAKGLRYLGISSWNSPQLIQRAGDLVEGAAFPVAFNTLNPPEETKQFYDLFHRTHSSYPGELEAVAFDAATIVLETLKDAPGTRGEFTGRLEARKNVAGATGSLSMVDHRCSRNLDLYKVKKGVFEPVGEP
jgi:ABC-type branched-subunit amino acid transport system substrate-binding protein